MARYIDVENIRKLFDNEYKSTRKLINEGETHLDNLAEGFSEATRVLDMIPTADVVPKSEVDELKADVEVWKQNRFNIFQRIECYDMTRKKVAREIFEEIDSIFRNHFEISSQPTELKLLEPIRQCRIFIINEMWDDVTKLKKKYTEEK